MATLGGSIEEPMAHYFHASLYKFSMIARATVISTFRGRVGDIAARCFYDEKKDLFSLDCPTSQGAFCHEQLYDVITIYVEEELASAERDQRRPEVQQFSESKWEWDHDREDGPEPPVNEDTPRATLPSATTAHTVIAPDECKHLKFFTMAQLPETFLHRVLCPRNLTTQATFLNGLTCRAVFWKLGKGFVFNGRDGGNSLHGSTYRQVNFPDFPLLIDTRAQAILDALDRTERELGPARQRKLGSAPGVDSWIQTVEDTTQVAPDEASDLPTATKKMLAGDEMRTSGRPRVPLGYKPGVGELDVSSDEDEKPVASAVRPDFAATMLHSGLGHRARVRDFSDSEESSDSERPTKPAKTTGRRASFTSMIPKSENRNPLEQKEEQSKVTDPVETASRLIDISSQSRAPLAAPASVALHSTASQPAYQDPPDFIGYDKKFARLDNFGLTGDARSAASHALGNHIPTPVKAKRHPVMPRTRNANAYAGTEVEGTILSASSANGSMLQSVPPTAATDNKRPVAPASWEKNITVGRIATDNLIDATSTVSTTATAIPPGLTNASQSTLQRGMPSTQETSSNSVEGEALIDLVDRPSRPSTLNKPPTGQTLHSAAPAVRKTADSHMANHMVAGSTPALDRKSNTTIKKAGKKSKSKGKKSTKPADKKPKVELPMPDPLPAPRSKKVVKTPEPSTRRHGTGMGGPAVRTDDQHFVNPFQQVLIDTDEKQSLSDEEIDGNVSASNTHKLVLGFCQILLLPEEAGLHKQRASTPKEIEKLMASSEIATKCFPRLSSSSSDGNILVELIGAGTAVRLVYEALITDAVGRKLTCTIPADNKAGFTVTRRQDAIAYEYLHYPVHVWDAKMSLVQSEEVLESHSLEAISQFVSSMTTVDGPPSFCAYVTGAQFEVQAVFANRIFETVKEGVTFRAVEKQALHGDHYLSDGRHNYAYTASAVEEMIFDQRMWWEVVLETDDLTKREELLSIATFMVENMDGIGIENVGAWMSPGEDEEEENKAPALLYDALGRDHLEKMKLR